MWGHKRSEAPLTAPSQPAAMDPGEVLSAAWKSLSKTKAALRHIENRLEASPGTGVLLDSVMENKKTSGGATRKVSRRDGRNAANPTHSGPDSKTGATGRRGSEKRSRSPLRVTTLGDNVRRTNCVEFKEPLASYREPTPPPLTPSQLEARSLLSEVPPSVCNDSRLSQLVYQRDTRDQQTHVLDSTCSSTLDSTVVRYLNDRPALDALRQPAWPARTDGPGGEVPGSKGKTSSQEAAAADASQSSSPGSSSRRLESLRRKQPDEKLEKLKDRIRRQREHLEEAVEGERALGAGGGADANTSAPTAKVRKVAVAPPAPIYKGFNPSETKIRTPDGKVWREEEFQKLSRDIYRDLSLQLSENAKMKQRPAESEREKKPSKPVRKVHKSAPLPSAEIKPAAPSINTASWREGQKLVKMVLGPAPRVPREPKAEPAERAARKGPPHRAKSDSRPGSTERPLSRAPSKDRTGETQPTAPATRPEEGEERALLVKDLLPPDIRDILDDLQLEGSAEGLGQKEGPNGGGLPTAARARARPRGSRSASPAMRGQDSVEAGPKRRHYDTDSVRQYITRQQEERRRWQQEERKAQREEAERRNKRLQELYRKQRESVSRAPAPAAPEAPAQKRMQETYTELMLEQARLVEELPQPLPVIDSLQPKPLYQPSGESDKENRRLDRPQSASSSSDLSLSEPQLTRDELGHSRLSWMQSDCFSSLAPPMDHRFTQRLDPDSGMSGLQRELQQPWAQNVIPTAAAKKSKMNRIEALKATAASLSTRIETEARKLAGGINYGCSRGCSDVDVGLPPQLQDDGRWAKLVSPPVREPLEPPDLELRVQRLLSAAQTAYGETLPGVGNLHAFRNPKDRDTEVDRPHSDSPAFVSQNRPVEGLEARVSLDLSEPDRPLGFHDSSGDSISEGPLMSEGSLSEGDSSPQAGTSRFPGPAERIRAPEHCAARQDVSRPAFQFQREAERLPPFDSLSHLLESRGPWEELAKGSPHSVISIFTKHLPSNSKAMGKMDGSPPPLLSASPVDKSGYEDDFVSSRSSGGSNQSGKRGSSALGSGSRENSPHIDLLSRRSPYTSRTIDQLSYHSSVSTPVSSPRSAGSVHKTVNDTSEESVLERTLVEGQKRPSSNASEPLSQESRRSSPGKSSSISVSLSADTDGTLGGISGHSPLCLESDGRKTPKSPAVSPSGSPAGSGSQRSSPDRVTPAGRERPNMASSPSQSVRSAVPVPVPVPVFNEHGAGGSSESKTKGELHYTPGVLQQRMTAELGYLDTMEESVRQLCDMERLRSVSLAQQESVSLAQVIKSQQQKHEHDLFLLKLKTEREELDTKRQLEEAQQRAARARVELQENMAQSRQESLGGLQDATIKMIGQQAEAVRFTADAARHIKEMTELARSQIAEALSVPAAPITTLFDQQRQHNQAFMKQLQSPPATDSRKTAGSPGRTRSDATLSSLESTPRSPPFRTPTISASRSGSTSPHVSPSPTSSGQKSDGPVRKERAGSSVEEEVCTAADDSIRSDSAPSLLDEKDSASVTTEYSLKFDESIVEGETEERSFRSLLPSESHRRFSLDKKRDSLEDSEEECRLNKSSLLDASKQDGSMSFSSGQDSFSRFTMDMVRQYMKEEEVRAQHQSSLLRLREKALKEKTKAELAWLEHQKRHLRNKGEDDKMPPIRKRQRGLLLRLQQEQVEIKRLHDANKAARKERQLLLKQQEDIERMRHTTLKLKERLKSAGETGLEAAVSDPTEKPVALTPTVTDLETRSTSPVSVSGSETSSIMQKLKKMRCHMDEKFLTKREQQLVQRRRYAEELLQWKRRLDAEEAEVRRMEEQALAAWDGGRPRDRRQRRESPVSASTSAGHHSPEGVTERERVGSLQGKTERGREPESESSCSPVVTISSLPAEDSVQEELGSASTDQPVSELPSPHKEHSQEEDSVYSQEFDSTSDKKLQGSSSKPSLSASRQPGSSRANEQNSGSSRMQLWSASKSTEPWSGEPQSVSQSEATSDQSDVECRIRALKQELRQRKSVVHQLKKEQKKRHKERLKAQEASLLKQLESYNDFIQKTKAELDKEPDATPTTKPQIKTRTSTTEKPRIKPPPLQSKNWKSVSDAEKGVKVQSDSPTEHAISENLTPSGFTLNREDGASDEDPATVTPTPVLGSPEHLSTFENSIPVELQPRSLYEDAEGRDESARSLAVDSEESIISSHKFQVLEELEHRESDNDRSRSRSEELFSEPLLKLDQELQPPSLQQHSPTEDRLPKSSPENCEPGLSRVNEENKIESSTEDEDLRSASALISRPECAAEESKGEDDQSPEGSSSVKERPHSHDSDIQSPGRETPAKNREESPPPPADSYRDDFESSVESSPQQGYLGTQSTSPAARGKDQGPYSRSPLYSTEEEISEDLSEKSSSSSGGCLSEGLLDLNSLPKDSIVKEAGDALDTLSPKQSPVTSRPQTPTSQTLDEMPDFSIGDRVLVSNVQPGTLRFKGPTRFANGFWAGVELDKSEGSNNGTYDGVVYFECEEDHGIFAPPDKISQLPEKFETYVDSTEDEDSFFDEASDNETKKQFEGKEELSRQDQKDDKSERDNNLQDKAPSDVSEAPIEHSINQVSSEKDPFLIPEVVLELDDLKSNSAKKMNGSQDLTPSGKSMDIILELEDASACDYDLLISEVATRKQALEKVVSTPLLDLLAREKDKAHQKPFLDASQEKIPIEKLDSEKKEKPNISALSDQLLNVFVKDAVKQFQQIKKDRNEKILASNQLKGHNDIVDNWIVRETSPPNESPYSAQLDGLPSFEEGQAEVSSPELCVRPESPVLGASGQELAKRLAELELSRELFDVLGDEQDWFDEDFGLSSKKEQQNQQQQQQQNQQQQQQQVVVLGPTRTEEESRVKTPVKPEPPRQAKPPEEPVMVVPHTVPEVEQLAHAATQLIWKSCNLGQGRQSLAGVPTPVAPEDYLGCNAEDQGRESLSSRSYRQAVFDLTWEIIQEIYAEDPSVHQPLWVKPYRTSSSYFRRVKSPGNITEVQAFVTNEVLKLYGLKKDQNQKTDWQKMLKFGRKKRDRVDHILVQELHEEESQWVNYDEDELFVKMQLADGIFDALVKDTADVFTQIQEKRVKRCLS